MLRPAPGICWVNARTASVILVNPRQSPVHKWENPGTEWWASLSRVTRLEGCCWGSGLVCLQSRDVTLQASSLEPVWDELAPRQRGVVWVPTPFLWLVGYHTLFLGLLCSLPLTPRPVGHIACYPCRSSGLLCAGTNKEWILNLGVLGPLPCLLARSDLISLLLPHNCVLFSGSSCLAWSQGDLEPRMLNKYFLLWIHKQEEVWGGGSNSFCV